MGLEKVEDVDISMIICTRNRASQLASVLDSACRLIIPPGLNWEFIVVDNGSSDGTGNIVSKYTDRLPIRCVREVNPGLSNARNCGVKEAQGKYICWTDDDVIIDPSWISAYAEAFKRHPEAAIFGGNIFPVLEKPTPDWFEKARYEAPLTSLMAYRNISEYIIPFNFAKGRIPWGANFAIRTLEQKRFQYNPELGVSPAHKRVGEETDVIYRIFKEGATGWWVPGSIVNHIIPVKRQTLRYLYDYSFLAGETFSYLRDKYPRDNHLLAGGVVGREYSFSKQRLYLRMLSQGFKFVVATIFSKKSKLVLLREFGYYAGAASYRKSK